MQMDINRPYCYPLFVHVDAVIKNNYPHIWIIILKIANVVAVINRIRKPFIYNTCFICILYYI
jgi:hypothetical protein